MKNFTRKNEFQIVALSLSLGATVCFFSPFELLVSNQSEFLINPKNIMLSLLLTALAAIAGCILLFNLLLLISEKLYRLVRSLLFGFLISGYIQMLFYNGRMTLLNKDDPIKTETSLYGTVNYIIYALFLLLPLIITVLHILDERKQKPTPEVFSKIITLVAAAIFLMQGVGALSSALTCKWIEPDDEYPNELTYFSYEGVTNLSSDENVIVFLVDRFAGMWMDTALECYPELNDSLTGFTYYRDCVSCYLNTFPSVAQAVTGRQYTGQTWKEYLDDAWSGDNVLKVLKDNGYSVNLSIDSSTTYATMKSVASYADNIVKPDADNKDHDSDLCRINYLGDGGVVPVFLKYSMAKLVPYYVKYNFLVSIGTDPTARFMEFREERIERQPTLISNDSDMAFLNYVNTIGLRADNTKKNYIFVHLNGVHNPRQFYADLAPDHGAAAPNLTIGTARGVFTLLNSYFDKMKKLGVYDNSTIIIMADHGNQNLNIPELRSKGSVEGSVSGLITTLLYKPKNAPSVPLQTDDAAQLSNQYIPSTVLNAAGIDHSAYGTSFQDILAGGTAPERCLRIYEFYGFFSTAVPDNLGDLLINGSSHDDSNWRLTDAPEK